jgi:integrase
VHDLRHSFCTLARRRGIAESVVMQSSGHKTRAVFDRYNLVDESDARELAKVMEAARLAAAQQRAARDMGQRAATAGAGAE